MIFPKITGSGREIWIESFSKPIKIGDSTADFVTIRDITEKKKSQELVLHSEKMLTLGYLAAGMAHELNNPQGTGLGLYVAYFLITTHHNGAITAESKPGKGAKFRITLPLE